MRQRRVIASLMLCMLVAASTLAVADSDRGRGDRNNDRESKSEERSKKQKSQKQRAAQRGDNRDWRAGDNRRVVERRDPYRGRQVVERRAPSRYEHDRWSGDRRTNEHVVSRTPTPSGWHNRAVRGHAQYATWDGYRARRWVSEHRTWRARGGYQGYRIPDHRYQVVFGPRHRFRIDNCPLVVVSGYPRFYYGGYWVTFIDPWPEYWPDYWFAQDDCYVVYDYDGYYLMNARYPSVRIAVSFTLS